MTPDHVVVLLHLLGATVWTGGHLILALGVLPRAVREQDIHSVHSFEERFQKLGITALLVLIVTGVILADRSLGGWSHVFDGDWAARAVLIKLILLLLTVLVALHARFRVVTELEAEVLPRLAWNLRLMALFAVLFVVFGTVIRFDGTPIPG